MLVKERSSASLIELHQYKMLGKFAVGNNHKTLNPDLAVCGVISRLVS